jgi:benzodiazapine receptor
VLHNFLHIHETNALPAKETQKTYLALKQPPYRPPPQVFGPAWTLLYGLMGYSAYRAYSVGMSPFASAEKQVLTKHGATLYTIQLGLNLIWMPLFFWAKRPIEATVDIVALTGKLSSPLPLPCPSSMNEKC